jgi:hypothetical protein
LPSASENVLVSQAWERECADELVVVNAGARAIRGVCECKVPVVVSRSAEAAIGSLDLGDWR